MMTAILAIEPDRRQAARLTALARGPIHADILVVPSVDQALAAITRAVPDLILTPLLLSPRDDASLTARLRELAADGSAVQTLVIPVLAASSSGQSVLERGSGLLNRLRRTTRSDAAFPDGCDPLVFAAQVNEYLERLAAERHERAEARAKKEASERPAVFASAPMLQELLPPVRLEPQPSRPLQVPALREVPGPRDLPVPHDVSVLRQVPVPLDMQASQAEAPAVLVAPAADAMTPDVVPPVTAWRDAAPVTPVVPEPAAAVPDAGLAVAPVDEPIVRRVEPPPAAPKAVVRPIRLHEPPAAPDGSVARRRGRRAPKEGRPIQDEWGLYDPEQCGFAALLARLDKALEAEVEDKGERKRSAIMRR